ncbi:MAG: PD-(D/E)XK nuclease family protein [Bacteroidota bacterium]
MPVLLQHGSPGLPRQFHLTSSLVIVPTRRRIRHLSRELIKQHSSEAASSLLLFTLETFATRLFADLQPGKGIINGAMKSLLIHRAILSRRRQLKYFTPREGPTPLQRGTFEKIINVLDALKESGVYPETLEEEISLAELDERQKLKDIIEIYKAYEAELDVVNGVDLGGVYRSLSLGCTQEQFAAAFSRLFPEVRSVSLAGFDEFTEPEIGCIRKLGLLNGLTVSLVFDYRPGNVPLFGHLEENYRRFLDLGFHEPSGATHHETFSFVSHQDQSAEVKETVIGVARRLFNKADESGRTNLSAKATIVAAKDRADEVRFVCRTIKQSILAQPGRDLSRICVAMRHPEKYTLLFRKAFAEYGIPANITDRFGLSSSPVVVALLGLLQISVRGYKRDDVLRVAGSPYFSFRSGTRTVDAANLAAVSGKILITGGYTTWLNKIEARERLLRDEATTATEPFLKVLIEKELRFLEKARGDIETLGALLQPFNDQCTPAEFQRRVQSLIADTAVTLNIVRHSPEAAAEKESRAFARLMKVLDEMVSLMVYQDGKNTKHTLRHYIEYLKVAVANERYNVRERFGYGVLVTSIEETRGLPMETMFLVGLVDGEFPSVYQPEIFYSLARQKKRAQRHTWEQRYLFYQAITNWSEHLYLTYPEQDGELETVRSTFIDAFTDIADVEVWKEQPVPPILSEQEYLRAFGQAMGEGRSLSVEVIGEEKTVALTTSIRVEKARIESGAHSPYGGYIFDAISEEGKARLRQLKERVYSVSQLETYGKCPHQFFADRVLKLQRPEKFEEELSPRERGSVLHAILFEFYSSRVAKKLTHLQGCDDATYSQALHDLLTLARNKLSAMEIPDPFWDLEKELILGRSKEDDCLLKEFLDYERGRKVTVSPAYFEVAFGPKVRQGSGADPFLSTDESVMAGEVRLRGKVDRIETNDNVFAVVDYKTGRKVPDLDQINRGISLQLPLYLHAVEELLERKLSKHLVPAAGLYYQLRDDVVGTKVGIASGEHRNEAFEAGPRVTKNIMPTDADLRTLINDGIARANSYIKNVTEGIFPLTTPDKMNEVCGFCDFKTICRVQSVHHVVPVKENQT